MYLIVYTVLLALTLYAGVKTYRELVNPISIWASLWSAVGILSNLAFYGYNKPLNYVNAVITIGIIVHTLFCLCYHEKCWTRRDKGPLRMEEISVNLDMRMFLLINIVAICIEIPFLIRSLIILVENDFSMTYLRVAMTDPEKGVITGGLISIIRDSGVRNVFTMSALYASFLIFTKQSGGENRKVIAIAIAEMLIYCCSNAARAYAVNFIFYLLLVLFLCNSSNIIEVLRKNLKLVCLFVLLVAVVLLVQYLRTPDMPILKTVYMYYCSGPAYLSELLKDPHLAVQVDQDFRYGTATFGFLANIYYYIKTALTGINDSTVKLLSSVITVRQYKVGAHVYVNAMCTGFYAFLVDWGTLGAIIGPLVTGWFSSYYYKRMKQRRTIGQVVICVYIFYCMIRTVFEWDLLYIDFVVLLVLNGLICSGPRTRAIADKAFDFMDRTVGQRVKLWIRKKESS